jgi:hypothetical protein
LQDITRFMYDLGGIGVPRRTKGFMKRISALVGVLGVLALLAVPGIAAASSSTCQAYSPQTCSSVSNGTVTTGDTTNTTSSGTLPFTGLDVALLVAGGGTLLVAGFVVRRLSRRLN